MNQITIIGNLANDPTTRDVNAKKVCSFSVAVNRRYKDSNGNRVADFFSVQVWGNQAPYCEEYLAKGRKVAVSGSMQSRKYQNRDGQQVTAWEINAENVEFLSEKTDNGAAHTRQAAAAQMPAGAQPLDDDDDLPF